MEISKASRSPAWSIPVTVRVKRTWMTWWWSEAQQTNVTKRQRQNKDESWIKPFSLSLFTLNHKKFSQKGFIFCFCSVPFLFHFFSFNIFPLFYHYFFLCSLFSFILLFISFAFLSLFISLISPFFLFISISVCVSLSLLWQRTKHVTKRNEWRQWWNGHQCLTRRSLVGVFLSITEGLSWWTWINQGECHGWWFLARFGSKSVFLVTEWLVCDTDSPRDIRWWMLIIISLCFFSLSTLILLMFTLHPQHVAKSYWKDWATWGGEAEPRGFDGLCRRSKEDRARKTKICGKATQRLGRRNKQTGR